MVCAWFIRIRRWRRQVCRRTVSCLPNFLLSFRHYLISVIQPVLSLWLEQGWSWSEVVVRCSQDGLPALRTGVPRQINRVCTTVLLAGMIDEATIRQVIADMNRS